MKSINNTALNGKSLMQKSRAFKIYYDIGQRRSVAFFKNEILRKLREE